MCISHNSFIRGFNSIYQQAPRLKRSDCPDFIAYALAWHRLVEEHHHYEETGLFLEIDKATGQQGVMSHEVEQHGKFNTTSLYIRRQPDSSTLQPHSTGD
jgi:hemerythrin-like domain-containing protein